MALVHNLKEILSEHDNALYEDILDRDAEHHLDWEALDMNADAMTSMVYQNINENFKKSFFGQFIKSHYFEKSMNDKSPLEQSVFAHGFCVVVHLNTDDINFSISNNPFSEITEIFSDLCDLKEFSIVLEFNTCNSDLSRIENYEVRASVERSQFTYSSPANYLIDFASSLHLKNGLNRQKYPEFCNTRRKKVIYSIFEYDSICQKYDIDLEYLVNHYDEAHSIINDYSLVNAMEKV